MIGIRSIFSGFVSGEKIKKKGRGRVRKNTKLNGIILKVNFICFRGWFFFFLKKARKETLGFNAAKTNFRIARILGILLMINYLFAFYFSDIIVVCAHAV